MGREIGIPITRIKLLITYPAKMLKRNLYSPFVHNLTHKNIYYSRRQSAEEKKKTQPFEATVI